MLKRSNRGMLALQCVVLLLACLVVFADDAPPPVQIQVKAEIYEITARTVRDLGRYRQPKDKAGDLIQSTIKASDVDGMRSRLRDSGAKMLGSPIISTIENQPAKMSIDTVVPAPAAPGDGGIAHTYTLSQQVQVTPRVNDDKSLTLVLSVNVPEEYKPGSATEPKVSSISTTWTMPAGDTLMAYGLGKTPSGHLLVLVTATIVPDKVPSSVIP